MSIPKDPRQQMINIMYLVLIALLALSVSAEILNAFKAVNRGISNSNKAIDGQIDATLLAFEEKVNKNQDGRPYYEAAQKASDVTNDLIKFIDELELELKRESGMTANGELQRPEDQDSPASVLLANEETGKAYDLQERILETRQKYLELFAPFPKSDVTSDVKYLNMAMPLNAPPPPADADKKDWATYNFYQMPVIGAVTLLNQIRNDAYSTEAMVVQRFSEKVGGVQKKIVFDKMKAAVIPNSNKIMEGDPVNVEIFLAATSMQERPQIVVNNQSLPLRNDNSALYQTIAQGLGRKTLNGAITIADGSGGTKSIPFATQYDVIPRPPKDQAQELDKQQRDMQKMRDEIARLQQENSELKKPKPENEKLAIAQKRINDLEKNLKSLENVEDKFKQLQLQTKAATKSQTDANQIQQELLAVKVELDKVKKENANLRKADKDEKLKLAQTRIDDLENRLKKVKTIEDEIRNKDKQVADLKQQLSAAQSNNKDKELKDLQDRVRKLQNVEEELRKRDKIIASLKNVEQELRKKDKTIADLKNVEQDLKKLKNIEQKLREKDKIIADLRKNDSKVDVAQVQKDLQEAKQQMQRIKADLDKARKENSDLRKSSSDNKLASAQKEIDKLRQQVQQKDSEAKKLQQELRIKEKVVPALKTETNPTGTVAPTKMNVFYIGVDNPIDVSVSGASLDQVKASIDVGKLTPAGRGKYMVRVPAPPGKRTNITLTINGTKISKNEFRIKKIPDPIPQVAGKSGGKVGTGEMKAQQGVIALLKDFDFDAKFEVKGFELTLAERGQDLLVVTNKGPRFNENSRKLLDRSKVGSIYYFDNIKVVGPDKITRTLPSISFKVR